MGKSKKGRTMAAGGSGPASASAASAASASARSSPASGSGSGHSGSQTKARALPVWRRAWVRDAAWTEAEFKEVAFWAKQVLALATGCGVGAAGIVGYLGNMVFLGCVLVGFFVYTASFLGVDPEDVGGAPSIAGEGLLPSYCLFLLVWTLWHTARDVGVLPDGM